MNRIKNKFFAPVFIRLESELTPAITEHQQPLVQLVEVDEEGVIESTAIHLQVDTLYKITDVIDLSQGTSPLLKTISNAHGAYSLSENSFRILEQEEYDAFLSL